MEYVSSKVESSLAQVKNEMETIKELDRYSREPSSSSSRSESYTLANTPPTSSPDIQDKLKSLAILVSSSRSAVSRIEREVHGIALNVTQLMYLQRNTATKQFINAALLGLKNQSPPTPYYPVMPQSVAGVSTGSDFIWTPNSYGPWNLTNINCKYAPRKFGINKIQLFGGAVKDPFFVNCFDGWTVSIVNRRPTLSHDIRLTDCEGTDKNLFRQLVHCQISECIGDKIGYWRVFKG